MSKPIDKSTLGYLGADFQYKLVKCFIEEPGFFSGIYSVVEQNSFTEPLLRKVVGALKDYYSATSVVPSYETIATVLKQKARMENELEELDEFVAKLKEMSPEGTSVVEESATRFFKQQNMVKVANEIIKMAQDGDDNYEKCQKMMEEALSAGGEDDMGFNPYDVVDEVMHPNSEIPIPTGISKIDELLNGGLFKGHVGLVLGPSGFGKTTFSTAIASHASICPNDLNNHKGWKVLQICFEDDVRAISRKHFSRITQIEAKDLTNPYYIDEAREYIDNFEGKDMFHENLVIKKWKTGTKSVEDVRIFIKKLINSGFKPDLIILDYFECLKLIKRDRNETKWDLQENTMRELEVLAEEFNVALWVMTQGNKESFVSSVVRMDQAGGSVTKVQIGHVVLSIARGQEDIDANKATIALLKNRQGKAGPVFEGIKFNNGTCTISCDEVIEYDNGLTYEDAQKEAQYEWRNRIVKQMNEDRKRQRELGIYEELSPIVTVQVDTETGEEKVIEPAPIPVKRAEPVIERKPEPVAPAPIPVQKPVETAPVTVQKPAEIAPIPPQKTEPPKVVMERPVAPSMRLVVDDVKQPFKSSPEDIETLDNDLSVSFSEWESGF